MGRGNNILIGEASHAGFATGHRPEIARLSQGRTAHDLYLPMSIEALVAMQACGCGSGINTFGVRCSDVFRKSVQEAEFVRPYEPLVAGESVPTKQIRGGKPVALKPAIDEQFAGNEGLRGAVAQGCSVSPCATAVDRPWTRTANVLAARSLLSKTSQSYFEPGLCSLVPNHRLFRSVHVPVAGNRASQHATGGSLLWRC